MTRFTLRRRARIQLQEILDVEHIQPVSKYRPAQKEKELRKRVLSGKGPAIRNRIIEKYVSQIEPIPSKYIKIRYVIDESDQGNMDGQWLSEFQVVSRRFGGLSVQISSKHLDLRPKPAYFKLNHFKELFKDDFNPSDLDDIYNELYEMAQSDHIRKERQYIYDHMRKVLSDNDYRTIQEIKTISKEIKSKKYTNKRNRAKVNAYIKNELKYGGDFLDLSPHVDSLKYDYDLD